MSGNMMEEEPHLLLSNQRSKMRWTQYLAVAYAEGFCEGEDATPEEQIEAWAIIIKYKMNTTLQGWFGRACASLIARNIIDINGTINWEEYENANL